LEAEHHRIVRLTVFGHGRVELREPLQAGELVEDEPDRPMTGWAAVHQPQHEHLEPQARKRDETDARLGRAREKQPSAPVASPRCGTPAPGRLGFARQQLQRVRHHVERGQDAAALRRRLSVDDRGVRRRSHALIELLVMTQPRRQFFGGRPEREQVREDAPRAFGEERIFIGAIGKERRRQRQRFRLVTELVAGAPIRRPGVDRIEDHVAAFGPVELRCVFQCRVVHDGRVAAVLQLLEDLSNQRRLAGPGVAHDKQMARLDRTWNLEDALDAEQPGRQRGPLNKPDAVRARAAIESARGHQLGSLQPAAVATRARPLDILGDRDQETEDQDDDRREHRRSR
jgi:hypothetical protein